MSVETNPNVFTQDRIWQAYEAASRASNDAELSVALGITEHRLKTWKDEHPAFYRAIQAARKVAGHQVGQKLTNYVASVLPEDLKELWDTLMTEDITTEERIRLNLASRGEHDKQRLFCYGLVTMHYDVNKVCSLLGISKSQVDRWIAEDPRFLKLFEEVEWARKNFLESTLMRMVGAGNVKATIFANQTKNRDRGYGQTIKVEGQVNHVHAMVDLSKLNLDLETRSKILIAIQEAGMTDLDGLLETDPIHQRIIDGEVVG